MIRVADDRWYGSSKTRCEFCGGPITPERPRTMQWTCGWVEHRAKGGGHAIRMAEREPRYAHKDCIDLILQGIDPGQGQLW